MSANTGAVAPQGGNDINAICCCTVKPSAEPKYSVAAAVAALSTFICAAVLLARTSNKVFCGSIDHAFEDNEQGRFQCVISCAPDSCFEYATYSKVLLVVTILGAIAAFPAFYMAHLLMKESAVSLQSAGAEQEQRSQGKRAKSLWIVMIALFLVAIAGLVILGASAILLKDSAKEVYTPSAVGSIFASVLVVCTFLSFRQLKTRSRLLTGVFGPPSAVALGSGVSSSSSLANV